MHGTNVFFGTDGEAPVIPPDPLRFFRRCGAEGVNKWPVVLCAIPSNPFLTTDSSTQCSGCGREPNGRIKHMRDAGISEVHCGCCDHGPSANILRSWKSTPGNERSCLSAGRRLGEILLWRGEYRFSDESASPEGDGLVPMPGWWGRRLRRGFDPSLRLAEGTSEILGWPVWCPMLRVHGRRMAGKSRGQRRMGSRRLFQMRPESRLSARRAGICGSWTTCL